MSRRSSFKFLLYVAGDTPNSVAALANITALCDAHLGGRHEIEIVNVLKNPKRALTDGIFMTPTLVKLSPHPVQKIVGTLSQNPIVMQALGMEMATS